MTQATEEQERFEEFIQEFSRLNLGLSEDWRKAAWVGWQARASEGEGELVKMLRELDPINCQPPFDHDGECSYCGTKEGRQHPVGCTWEKLKALARTQNGDGR